jgi:hypothetical protein
MTAHYGTAHPRAKLEDGDIKMIRELLAHRDYHRRQAEELTYESIAEKFGVHEGTIRRIHAKRNWIHI